MKKKQFLISLGAICLALVVTALILFLPRAGTVRFYGGKMEYEALAASPGSMVRADDGSFYVTDAHLHVIWKVSETSAEIVAGSVTEADTAGVLPGGYRDGAAETARFDTPTAIFSYREGYLISDTGNHVLRYFDPEAKTVITFAGTGVSGNTDGVLEKASFASPGGICRDEAGNLYVADSQNHSIRKIDTTGYVSTFLGAGQGFLDGSFDVAKLSFPTDIAYFDGVFYISDTGNAAVRAVEGGELVTLLGSSVSPETHGALRAELSSPTDLFAEEGALWIADTGKAAVYKFADGALEVFSRASSRASYPISPRALWVEADAVYMADSSVSTLEVLDR